MNPPVRAVIFATESAQKAQIAASLESQGIVASQYAELNFAEEVLRRERPDLLVAVPDGATIDLFARLAEAARGLKIAALAIARPEMPLLPGLARFDDWLDPSRLDDELAFRLGRLMARGQDTQAAAIDPRFLALVVHDLRTPLNVIGLTVRAIGQSNPTPSTEFDEDLLFLHENAKQIEKMLAQLGDFCRLVESERAPSTVEFQPSRFLAEFLEEKQSKRDSEYKAVRLEIGPGSPDEVALDPAKARLAIGHALANGVAAAGDVPVKLRSLGSPGRWIIEVVVDKAPPPTIATTRLQPHVFERLIGSAAERRGLDLAIASRVSELFGGTAQLEVEPGARSVVVLDWPARPTA